MNERGQIMAIVEHNEIKYSHVFDRKTKRHKINNIQSVLHCHHYSSLFAQLAIDANETELLKECTRDSFHKILDSYFTDNPAVDSVAKKIEIGCQYYSLVGLGKMRVNFMGEDSGEVELLSSHIDAGWQKKWGKFDKPVNYLTAGFIEALFETILSLPQKTFQVIEMQSIVMGAETSIFKILRRS
jgi:hypothetical protein